MRDDIEVEELFNQGDMVLLTLKNKEHMVGEFRYMDDLGVQLILESRTAYKVTQQKIVSTPDYTGVHMRSELIDVTKPYLQMLKKPVRMLIKWENIDEMCSAEDFAENAEIMNFAESLENGEFNRLIDETTGKDEE